MSLVYTATAVVERVMKIVQGDYPTAAMEARCWLILNDIYQQISDHLFNFMKVMGSQTVASAVQIFDLPSNWEKPIQIYVMGSNGSTRIDVPIVSDGYWEQQVTTTDMATYPSICRIFGQDTDGCKQLHISPMMSSNSLLVLYYDYYRNPVELKEYTTGTASIDIGSTGYTGASTQWTTFASAGDYIRIDAVGRWDKISSVTTSSNLTLTTGYITASQSAKAYTISNPVELSKQQMNALIYGTAAQMFTITGEKELASAYMQLFGNALARAKGSEQPLIETCYNPYTA